MRTTPKRRRCSLSLNPTTPEEPGTWYGFKLALSLPNQRHLLGADALLRALDHISLFEPQSVSPESISRCHHGHSMQGTYNCSEALRVTRTSFRRKPKLLLVTRLVAMQRLWLTNTHTVTFGRRTAS